MEGLLSTGLTPSSFAKSLVHSPNNTLLEDTACYAGLLLAPAEGFGREFFLPLGQKKDRGNHAVLADFRPFWCSVVTLVTFSSNLREGSKKINM